MGWSDYWGALSTGSRRAVLAGVVLIALGASAVMFWVLYDPYVPLAAGLGAEELNELAQELDRAKLDYRVDEGVDQVSVPRSQLGKAHAATAGPLDVPPSVGLELFKETDFSSTDFAQRINYQRALQGEIARTLQTIANVRRARVHVILPDGGLFKRNASKATAAVSVIPQPGTELTRTQVRGIQRLVAASVPEIDVDDVVVLDESGVSLTRPATDAGSEASSVQLDLKRQADQYLEGKLLKLLQDLVPQGTASLSVDTVLEDRQVRVTSDEPVAAREVGAAGPKAGVLVKERQSQRGLVSGVMQADLDGDDTSTKELEREYVVGRRTEQTVIAPGSIKRLSVSATLHGVSSEVTREAVEQLIANAVGIDRSRGDSVTVLLLPDERTESLATEAVSVAPAALGEPASTSARFIGTPVLLVVVAMLIVALTGAAWRARTSMRAAESVDVDAVATKVKQWLNEGARDGDA